MSSTETTQTPSTPTPPQAQAKVSPNLRKKKKAEGRKKRAVKLKTNKDFAKQYFEGKSKRSTDKKSAFRKKKSKKK